MRIGSLSGQLAQPLLLGATLLALLAGCSDSGKPAAAPGAARPPMAVTILEMQPQTLPASIEVVAQTEGVRETEVRAQVGGILEKQLYQEGEAVAAGQPLFQIDRRSYEITLASTRAQAEMTAREVKRLEELKDQKAVSRRDYDNAVSAHAIAQAALRQSQLNLSWTTVTAPVAGTVGRTLLAEGSLVKSGGDSALTSIVQSNPIRVRFSLAQSELAKLPQGRLSTTGISGVELLLPDGALYPLPGRVDYIAASIDPTLGTQQLRAEFPNAEGRLMPGQFVRARLLLADREGVFLVPQVAVTQSDKGRSVMLLDADNKVTPRPVQTAEWRGKEWVITDGLQAGDKVIIDNLIKLRPGMVVAPKVPGEKPSPSGKH
jgi:membrane fusion protein (multidrug efflux system)